MEHDNSSEQYFFRINGNNINFDDPIIDGRDALTAAGLTPASEYQLILIEKHQTHLILTDDKITIAEHPHGYFRAFHSDGTLTLTQNPAPFRNRIPA